MKVLISSCLLGQKVRYDGGHCAQNSAWLAELARNGALVSFCPEMEAGLGVPRDPIELKNGEVVNVKGQILTAKFHPVLEKLEGLIVSEKIVMAILKDKSPSCGSEKVYDGSFTGKVVSGQGLVAAWLSKRMPVFSENRLGEAQAALKQLSE